MTGLNVVIVDTNKITKTSQLRIKHFIQPDSNVLLPRVIKGEGRGKYWFYLATKIDAFAFTRNIDRTITRHAAVNTSWSGHYDRPGRGPPFVAGPSITSRKIAITLISAETAPNTSVTGSRQSRRCRHKMENRDLSQNGQ